MTYVPNIRATKKPTFLTFDAKKVFNYLQLVFIKALIFQYFDLQSYIYIEIDASGYIIGAVLSQLKLNFDALLNNSN